MNQPIITISTEFTTLVNSSFFSWNLFYCSHWSLYNLIMLFPQSHFRPLKRDEGTIAVSFDKARCFWNWIRYKFYYGLSWTTIANNFQSRVKNYWDQCILAPYRFPYSSWTSTRLPELIGFHRLFLRNVPWCYARRCKLFTLFFATWIIVQLLCLFGSHGKSY